MDFERAARFNSWISEQECIMNIALRESDDIAIIDIAGDICRLAAAAATLHPIIKSQVERGRRSILLNLEKVNSVDSFGIGELLASYISIQNAGGKVKFVGIPRRIDILFRIVGLDRVFEVYRTESSALESFIDS